MVPSVDVCQVRLTATVYQVCQGALGRHCETRYPILALVLVSVNPFFR